MLADVFVLCIAFRLCPEQNASAFPFPFFIAEKTEITKMFEVHNCT